MISGAAKETYRNPTLKATDAVDGTDYLPDHGPVLKESLEQNFRRSYEEHMKMLHKLYDQREQLIARIVAKERDVDAIRRGLSAFDEVSPTVGSQAGSLASTMKHY